MSAARQVPFVLITEYQAGVWKLINTGRQPARTAGAHAAGPEAASPPPSHHKALRLPVGAALRARGQAARLPCQARPSS